MHFLPRCDKVLVLDEGKVQHFGTYADLVASGVNFTGAVDFEEKTEETDGEAAEAEKEVESSAAVDEKTTAAMKKKGESLTTKEEREEGSVDSKAYIHYAKSGGYCMFFSLFFVQGLGRGAHEVRQGPADHE